MNSKTEDFLRKQKEKHQKYLKDLSIGDTVYKKTARFFDSDYHPQEIIEIDRQNSKVKVKEKGLNDFEYKWVDHFTTFIDEEEEFINLKKTRMENNE